MVGNGFGHHTLVQESGSNVNTVRVEDIIWRDKTGLVLLGLIGQKIVNETKYLLDDIR
jgi:hypothetical protein